MRRIIVIIAWITIFNGFVTLGKASVDTDCNDLTVMLNESLSEVLDKPHDNGSWRGRVVRGFYNDSIHIDSIFFMTDFYPQDIIFEKHDMASPIWYYSLNSTDFPTPQDTTIVSGIVLNAQFNLTGRSCQIIITENIIGTEKKTYTPGTALSYYNHNRTIKAYTFLYEFNCTTQTWEKQDESPRELYLDYEKHIVNLALYNSIVDFVTKLNTIPGCEYCDPIITIDETFVANPYRDYDFWYELTEYLRIRLEHYTKYMPAKYLKAYTYDDDDSIIIIPKVILHGKELSINIECKIMNEGIFTQTSATGYYKYTLDCNSGKWELTDKTVNIIPQ